jgi:predicted TIM-barrel fold metal-dependent hydrolase
MKTVGKDRVMFGTNWPMLDPARCLKGLEGLDLDEAHQTRFLSGLAKDVFKLAG